MTKDTTDTSHSTETYDQLDAFPESKGTSGGQPGSKQADSKPATQHNGSGEADPREDKPGILSPQDDSPQVLKEKDGGRVISSGRTL